jgi:peptide subunit release factor 1 (eRF1)
MMESYAKDQEHLLVEKLEESRGAHHRVASGLDDVLQALNQRRVAALIFQAGFSAPGYLCERCGWLSSHSGTCPGDGQELQAHDNVIEDAVETALSQSAEVKVLRHAPLTSLVSASLYF